MNFQEFKTNVEKWAEERGIYENSTTEAQLLKALSELGELADAVIKGDKDALKDAIGDVAVCMVNYAWMAEIDSIDREGGTGCDSIFQEVGAISITIGEMLFDEGDPELDDVFVCLNSIASRSKLSLMECCDQAWNEIKDRKGRMVAGGAFVKDE